MSYVWKDIPYDVTHFLLALLYVGLFILVRAEPHRSHRAPERLPTVLHLSNRALPNGAIML